MQSIQAPSHEETARHIDGQRQHPEKKPRRVERKPAAQRLDREGKQRGEQQDDQCVAADIVGRAGHGMRQTAVHGQKEAEQQAADGSTGQSAAPQVFRETAQHHERNHRPPRGREEKREGQTALTNGHARQEIEGVGKQHQAASFRKPVKAEAQRQQARERRGGNPPHYIIRNCTQY